MSRAHPNFTNPEPPKKFAASSYKYSADVRSKGQETPCPWTQDDEPWKVQVIADKLKQLRGEA